MRARTRNRQKESEMSERGKKRRSKFDQIVYVCRVVAADATIRKMRRRRERLRSIDW